MTRAEVLHYALAFALRNVHVGVKQLKLDEETRWQVAGEAIEELRKFGGWKELDEEAPVAHSSAQNPNDKRESWKPKPEVQQVNCGRNGTLAFRSGTLPRPLCRGFLLA